MDPLKDVVQHYQVLSKEWSKKPPNLEECGNVLQKLKVSILCVYSISIWWGSFFGMPKKVFLAVENVSFITNKLSK